MAKDDGLARLKQAISQNTPDSLYLLWGEEDYLREYYLERLKTLLLPKGLEGMNHTRLTGGKAELSALAEAVDALPVFCPRRLVEVRDFDLYKAPADTRDRLGAMLGDLPDTCCLVFVMTDPAFKPDKRTKLHAAVQAAGTSVEFKKQGQADLVNWIRRRFKACGKEIERQDAEYLIFYCGGLMTGLISEIEKLAACATGNRVTRKDIDAAAVPVLDAVVWNLTDALTRRDFDCAVKTLGELLQMRENPIMLLSVIGNQMRKLYTARLALEANRDAEYIRTLWDMKSGYPARLLMEAARKCGREWCREAVALCAQTDMDMKSTGRNGEELLMELLVKLAAE